MVSGVVLVTGVAVDTVERGVPGAESEESTLTTLADFAGDALLSTFAKLSGVKLATGFFTTGEGAAGVLESGAFRTSAVDGFLANVAEAVAVAELGAFVAGAADLAAVVAGAADLADVNEGTVDLAAVAAGAADLVGPVVDVALANGIFEDI